MPTYRTTSDTLAKAAAVGFGVAILVGAIWGYLPEWNFYLSLALGFGVTEAMVWASKGKRGVDLQVVGMAAVALGLVLGRVILAQRLGASWEQINQWGSIVVDRRFVPVEDALYLRLIPDGLFAALALAIVWYRFR